MKNLLSISLFSLLLLAVPASHTASQPITSDDVPNVAEIVLTVGIYAAYYAVDNSCNKKRPDGGFKVCKNNRCVSGKCISLRKSCSEDPSVCN